MKRFLQFISSNNGLIGLSLPLILYFVIFSLWLGLSPFVLAKTKVAQLYCVVLIIALAVRAVGLFRTRAFGESLLLLGLIVLLLHGAYLYGFRFNAKTSVGIGEGPDKYYAIDAGSWIRPPQIPVILKDVDSANNEICTIVLDGKEHRLSKGSKVRWNDIDVTLASIAEAPLFVLSDDKGTETEAGYIKLLLAPSGQDYFQFSGIPHRFYVSLPGRDREVWKSEGKQWKKSVIRDEKSQQDSAGKTLHLLVMRGKLTLLDEDVRQGESVPFEGWFLRFEQGAPWIELNIEKRQHRYLLFAGVVMLIAGGLLILWQRKRS